MQMMSTAEKRASRLFRFVLLSSNSSAPGPVSSGGRQGPPPPTSKIRTHTLKVTVDQFSFERKQQQQKQSQQ